MTKKFDITKIEGIVFSNTDEKALRRGKRIGNRFERFDPDAIDGDMDGTVQEGTSFERPAGPKNMPKVKPIEIPRPEEVPIKPPVPSTPTPAPTEVPNKPKVPQRVTTGRKLTGSISKRDKDSEIGVANSMLDLLEKDQDRIQKITNVGKKRQAISSHNAIWDWAQNLIEDDFDNTWGPKEFSLTASMINDISGGMPEPIKKQAAQLAEAYRKREKDAILRRRDSMADGVDPFAKKPEELRKRTSGPGNKLTGSIGRADRNTFEGDDEPFGEDDFDPNDLAELNRLQDEVLDEISEEMGADYDWDGEAERLLGPDADVAPEDLKEARAEIDAIKNWLKDHPFNRSARDYEESEWADDKADSQAQRYAPRPTEFTDGEEINWDKLLRTAGLNPEQKEDYELTDEEMQERQAQRVDRLGQSTDAITERAAIWQRVQNGESFREIAPDYPDRHWSLVRDMSRQGAIESGASKQDSRAAEQAASIAARQRAMNAASERLMDRMINASSESDLKRRLNDAIKEAKELKKRTSNEYQMMRKKQVELWRLASLLFETMPEQKKDEGTLEYWQRMRDWFFETSPSLKNFAEEINNNHDISTATDRSYSYLDDYINLLEEKRRSIQSFWPEVQAHKVNKNSSGGGMSGSMGSGIPRGVRIASPKKANKVDFRELDSIQGDLDRMSKGSFSRTASAKRPDGLNKTENTILSTARNAKKYPRGFFRARRKPKKA